jgi:hypothetical protein
MFSDTGGYYGYIHPAVAAVSATASFCVNKLSYSTNDKNQKYARKTTGEEFLLLSHCNTRARQEGISQLTHKVSPAACLYSQKGGCDKGVCTNQGSPLMQMKDHVGTNHGIVPCHQS